MVRQRARGRQRLSSRGEKFPAVRFAEPTLPASAATRARNFRPLRSARALKHALLVGIFGCCTGHHAVAVNRVVLEIGQLSTARVQAAGVTITLDMPSGHGSPAGSDQPRGGTYPDVVAASVGRNANASPSTVTKASSPILRARIGQLRLTGPTAARSPSTAATHQAEPGTPSRTTPGTTTESALGTSANGTLGTSANGTPGITANVVLGTTYTAIEVTCTDLLIRKPLYACNEGTLAARGGPLGQIAMSAAGSYDSSSGATSFRGSGLKVAGASTRFNGTWQSGSWALDVAADRLDLDTARKLAQPWLQLADGNTLSGYAQLRLESTGHLDVTHPPGKIEATLSVRGSDFNYSNPAGTSVAQNVAAAVTGAVHCDRGHCRSDLQLQSSAGQVLVGAVLLDFAKNPLELQAQLDPDNRRLSINGLRIRQSGLIEAQGAAQIALDPAFTITRAHLDISRLEFAAAYRTFLQLAAATTDFGALNVGGRAGGSLDIDHGQLSEAHAFLQNVSMADATSRLSLANANGEIHWVADPAVAVQPSQLSWSSSSAYGLIGGQVQMGFTIHGSDFTLARNTRFPVFDGALVIHTLAMRHLRAPDTEVDFDAHIEPISMPLLSKAFGWPILQGQLAGALPGVTYRDHVLAVQGDLVANVFDGLILGSHLKLTDPWGPWPRLNADVTARNLDLDLLTHTFSIGSISGRLDADIHGLELFNWSPVAFDARLQTTPGDRSRHLISQRAVTSISNVGGGGGGVAAALQSGILQFFKTFHYDRLGISCQLRDEICLMSGIEPARSGYYLVKGRGLPRIDIIGNAGRVDWTQLVGQISASMHSQNIVVR